jgi:hypothetical protein
VVTWCGSRLAPSTWLTPRNVPPYLTAGAVAVAAGAAAAEGSAAGGAAVGAVEGDVLLEPAQPETRLTPLTTPETATPFTKTRRGMDRAHQILDFCRLLESFNALPPNTKCTTPPRASANRTARSAFHGIVTGGDLCPVTN